MFQSNKSKPLYIIYIFISFFLALSVYKNIPYKTDYHPVLIAALFTFIIYCLDYCFTEVKDNFNFEVTPEKLCQGGPYMYSSNPEKLKYCQSLSPDSYFRYNCPCGFSGRPAVFQYTPLSDDKWQNTIVCNPSKEELDSVDVL